MCSRALSSGVIFWFYDLPQCRVCQTLKVMWNDGESDFDLNGQIC